MEFEEPVSAQAEAPSGEHWVCFHLNKKLEPNEFFDKAIVRIWTDPVEGLFLREVTDLSFQWTAGRQKEDGKWVMWGDRSYRFSRTKPEEVPANCNPENVINGYSRILDAQRYEIRS